MHIDTCWWNFTLHFQIASRLPEVNGAEVASDYWKTRTAWTM